MPATSPFLRALNALTPASVEHRRWLYIPYDQLTDKLGELATTAPEQLGIILIESAHKASRRPYHKQKLALILANSRHFALEQAKRGVAVHYLFTQGSILEGLTQALDTLQVQAQLMTPAERELRVELEPLITQGRLKLLPHQGWLTTTEDFTKSQGKRKQWLMDAFYKHVRKRYKLLMDEDGKPLGGKFSFDHDNREPWRGQPPAPTPPTFTPDAITQEVITLIQTRFAHHPGTLDPSRLPATLQDAQTSWTWALNHALPFFGPYEDAMSTQSRTLFHTLTSPLINLHRLTPHQVIDEVIAAELPLQSKEGFVRQVLGWREFMAHVHAQTDGLRKLPIGHTQPPTAPTPGDGGYAAWAKTPWPGAQDIDAPITLDGGAAPRLATTQPLPEAFWGTPSGLGCLDHVVEGVWQTGYSHHIERLMILSNLATLLELSPRQLTDWFWVAYIDAYDWVVEPNVLGMGTFSLGALFTTKPYIAGANYINRMSDYCQACAFDPSSSCPVTSLYWAYLERHKEALKDNFRLRMIYASLERRGEARVKEDAEVFERLSQALSLGQRLDPT